MGARVAGSFRDPSGHVYEDDGSIFRVVAPIAARDYEAVRDAQVFRDLVEARKLVTLDEVDKKRLKPNGFEAAYLLQHRRLPYISYPYEWSFSLLRDAALFHLDLHLDLLERGFTLSDASSYNVQFDGPHPIFIDHLSIRPYRDGEFWTGHRQFCEQFLNPLLLRALLGVPHNSWYRGNLEGIPSGDLAKLLRFKDKLSWNVFTHVVLPNRFQQSATTKESLDKAKARRLPLAAYKGMLSQLRRWIGRLTPDRIGSTVWGDYATTHTYSGSEEAEKRQFVGDFVKAVQAEVGGRSRLQHRRIHQGCSGQRRGARHRFRLRSEGARSSTPPRQGAVAQFLAPLPRCPKSFSRSGLGPVRAFRICFTNQGRCSLCPRLRASLGDRS